MKYTNLNGKIEAVSETPHFSNAAFRYGVGLFETMLVREGAIRFAQAHWDRLFAGMAAMGFEIPVLFTKDYLEEQVLRTVNRNGLQSLCRVRLQIFGAGGGLYDREHNRPLFLVECYTLSAEILQFNENGLEVGIAHGLAKANDAFSNFKSTSALVYAMAAQVAKQQKWNDALVLNTTGNVIESTIANIFWVKGAELFTPLLSEGCVAGVMRRHLLETIPGIREEVLTPEILSTAEEVFLTNSIRGLRWVGRFGDRKYSNAFSRQLFTSLP